MLTRGRLTRSFLAGLAFAAAASLAVRAQQNGSAPATARSEPLSEAALLEMAESVQQEVEEIRGWKFKHPVRKDIRNEKQLREFIEKRVFEDELGGGKLEGKEALLRMVGLIPPGCDLRKTFMDVLLNQVGGFYDPQTKAFYMLVRSGVDYGVLVNRIMIAHELTHALDDQYFDLDRLMKSRDLTEDWGYTIGAVVEGSATELMSRYAAIAMQSGKYDMRELQQVMESEMERSKAFLEAPPYFSTLIANYLCGMTFLLRGDLTLLADENGGAEIGARMKRLVQEPPESSEQILHPEKYWEPDQRDAPVQIDDPAAEGVLQRMLGPDVRITHRDTLGELLCGLLTVDEKRPLDIALAMLPDFWTNEASAGWGGDRFYVIGERPGAPREGNRPDDGHEPKGPRGVWITAWDTKRDRDEFIRGYELERKLSQRHLVRVGERVAVFLYGMDADARTALERTFTEGNLRFTRDGKSWDAADAGAQR